MAHTGCQRTAAMLKERAFWPRMQSDIEEVVLSCPSCQLTKGTNQPNYPPNRPIQVSSFGELWSVDVMGPFPTSVTGEQYLLVMTEHLTRWIEVAAIIDQRTATVWRAIMDRIVANHGIPQQILTDQGPCFGSEEFKQKLSQLGIKRVRTTPYHPQGNGLTERNNRTIKEWLAARGGDWLESLPWVLLGHRSTPQRAIQRTPFELIYGQKPRLPLDSTIGVWKAWQDSPDVMAEHREEAAEELRRTQRRETQKSEQTRSGKWEVFKAGDEVKWRLPNTKVAQGHPSRKLRPKWQGPFKVIDQRGSIYTISNQHGQRKVHSSQLRRWYTKKPEADPNETRDQSAISQNGNVIPQIDYSCI